MLKTPFIIQLILLMKCQRVISEIIHYEPQRHFFISQLAPQVSNDFTTQCALICFELYDCACFSQKGNNCITATASLVKFNETTAPDGFHDFPIYCDVRANIRQQTEPKIKMKSTVTTSATTTTTKLPTTITTGALAATTAAGVCPTGFSYISIIKTCFMLRTTEADWASSKSLCNGLGDEVHLVVVDTFAKAGIVHKFTTLETAGGSVTAWTAGRKYDNDQSTYYWQPYAKNPSDQTPLGPNTPWNPSSNADVLKKPQHQCVLINGNYLENDKCDKVHPYLCEVSKI